MATSLVGIRQRIKRADQHIRELDKLARAFRKRCRCRVYSKVDAQTGWPHFWIKRSPARIPWKFSIVTGEALYHLRSSLDHLVWQLVIREGKVRPSWQHQFPIYNHPPAKDRFERMIKGVPLAAKAAIEQLQPYQLPAAKRNSHPLSILSELNNADKHRQTLAVAQAYVETSRSMSVTGRPLRVHLDQVLGPSLKRIVPLKNGTKLGYIKAYPETTVTVKPSVKIAFKDIGLTKLNPVIPTLNEMRKAVGKIIDDFERDYF